MSGVNIDLMIRQNARAKDILDEMIRLDIQGVWIGTEWSGYYDRKTGNPAKTDLPPLIGDMLFWVGHYNQNFQSENLGHDGYVHVLNDL